jgi:hypothetical protein
VIAAPVPTASPWQNLVESVRQLHYEPDIQALEAMYAAAAAHHLPGQPVWAFCVAPSSSGKTELLMPLEEAEAILISTVTPRTFISGWTEERTNLDGSLLSRIRNGIIVCKDFSQMLSMPHRQRGPVLADLRDIYDGHIAKEFGTGRRKEWRGRITFIAGVTQEIDRHYSIYQSLGERFIQIRWKRPGGVEAALRAIDEHAAEARVRVRHSVRELFAPIIEAGTLSNPTLGDPDRLRIANLAEFIVRARTHVSRDGKTREMDYVPDAEASPRLTQQLSQLARGAAMLHGRTEVIGEDMALIQRVAFDCLPPPRCLILNHLNGCTSQVSNEAIVAATHLNKTMVSRQLEELHGLRLVERRNVDDFSVGACWINDEARELLRVGLSR